MIHREVIAPYEYDDVFDGCARYYIMYTMRFCERDSIPTADGRDDIHRIYVNFFYHEGEKR